MSPENLFIRMAQLARNPPPRWKVLLWAAVILLCLAVVGIEKLGFWPDWMTMRPRR
jgi:predicted membrane metal-binding protein